MIKAENVYFQVTVGVQQEVAGLEIAMKHIGRVNIFESPQYLIQKVAHMLVADRLCFQQLVQIGLHQTLHNVDIFHLINIGRPNYVLYVYNL